MMNTTKWMASVPLLAAAAMLSGCQPTADFDVASRIHTTPAHVAFENLSNAGLGAIRGYEWDFGDGSTSNEARPAHVYEREGVYTVRLTVYGTGGSHTLVKPAAVVVSDDLPLLAEADGGCYLLHVARPWAAQSAHRYTVYASALPGRVLRSLPEAGYGSRPGGIERSGAPDSPALLALNE
jgi:PKD repeat protein